MQHDYTCVVYERLLSLPSKAPPLQSVHPLKTIHAACPFSRGPVLPCVHGDWRKPQHLMSQHALPSCFRRWDLDSGGLQWLAWAMGGLQGEIQYIDMGAEERERVHG